MSQNVARLKELLFDRENATLAELQARIAEIAATTRDGHEAQTQALQVALAEEAARRGQIASQVDALMNRAGTEEQFRSSVADVLDGALREAEVRHHDQLSRAIAPLMIKTIKTELHNSRDEMVEALYPITGRLVKSYLASAMKDLLDQVNRRLSGGSNPVMLRLRSLMTGRSVAELALAETQRLEVAELFLIRRGAGELVEHWPKGPRGGDAPSNSDIHLSGVLTAINDFAAQALKDDGGNLRTFALDDFQVYLRASPTYLLAAKCRGAAPHGVEAIFDDEFLRLIERNGRALSDAGGRPPPILAPLAQSLEARLDEQQRATTREAGVGFRPLKVLATIVALPLLAWAGWAAFTRYEAAQVRDFATQAIAAMPQLAGYPVRIEIGPRGQELGLTGLVPTSAAKNELTQRLRSGLPSTTVSDRLAVLPNFAAELEPQVAGVRRELAGLEGETVRNTMRRAIKRAQLRLEQTKPHLLRLEPLLPDAAAKATQRRISGEVETIAGEFRTLLTRLGSGPVDMARIDAMPTPLHALADRLKQASVEMSTLLTRTAAGIDLAHSDAAPADAVESAEEVSLAAEQFATVAVAVAQTAGVKPVAPADPTARERLDQWARANALFFGDGAEFRSAEAAQAVLDSGARLMRATEVLVRVVGYTDERGGQARNTPLAQTRAQRVVDLLVERGVPRQQLIAVGRPVGIDISPNVGTQSPNRRVEFELGFDGETAGQP